MDATRVALVAAICAASAWAAKAVVIAVYGLGEHPLETVLFLAGLVSALLAAGALGAALTAGRATGVRAFGAVVAVVALLALAGLTVALVSAVEPPDAGWVWGELNLWVGAAALLGAATALARKGRRS